MTKRTKTVTETEVKDKEIEEFQCKNCEQWYEQENIMPVTVDRAFETNVCVNCSEYLFGLETETSNKAKAIKYLDSVNLKDLYLKYGIFGGFIALLMIGLANILPIMVNFLHSTSTSTPRGISGDLMALIAICWVFIFATNFLTKLE